MSTVQALFNILLVVMIVSTMFTAGLGITFAELGGTFRQVGLVVLVLVANLVVVPLLGWGAAALFSLATPAYVAMVLIASSPGAPFGAKLAMIQRGDVVAGSSLQVLLAAIGSVTFALTANWILKAANVGGGISLPVGDLVKVVVVLQVVPFLVGLVLRNWTPETAAEWRPVALKTSTLTLLVVFAGALLGSWQEIVALLGSLTLLAALLFTLATIIVGAVFALGSMETRTTMALVAPMRNAGPIFAAIGVAFNNSLAILGAVAAILVVQFVICIPLSAYLAKTRQKHTEAVAAESQSTQLAANRQPGPVPDGAGHVPNPSA